MPKTRVEAWRRKAYENASYAEKLTLSEWMRKALDKAAGIGQGRGESWDDFD